MTPENLAKELKFTKDVLNPGAKFGVDLALPQIGGGARQTNHDYTKGKLDEMIDLLCADREVIKLFISAIGVPPKWAVDKLHAAGIVCANMVGAPHHVQKALDVGVDLIIAQGTEAGGHTGDVATMPLIPQCVDAVRGKTNYFGQPVLVVAAGGIFDGRGLAAALSLGAAGVWVGTRFIACEESGASPLHKKHVLECKSIDTARTTAFTGRPHRMMVTPYVQSWLDRPGEVLQMTSEGKIPYTVEVRAGKASRHEFYPTVMGQAAGGTHEILPAKQIVESMVSEARESLVKSTTLLCKL